MAAAVLAGFALAAVALAAAPALAQGCAMCRTALTQSAEGRAMAESFNQAILVMLAAPYAVFGTCTAVVFRRRLAVALARVRARVRPLPGSSQPAAQSPHDARA